MAIKIEKKTYRNLPEQVEENKNVVNSFETRVETLEKSVPSLVKESVDKYVTDAKASAESASKSALNATTAMNNAKSYATKAEENAKKASESASNCTSIKNECSNIASDMSGKIAEATETAIESATKTSTESAEKCKTYSESCEAFEKQTSESSVKASAYRDEAKTYSESAKTSANEIESYYQKMYNLDDNWVLKKWQFDSVKDYVDARYGNLTNTVVLANLYDEHLTPAGKYYWEANDINKKYINDALTGSVDFTNVICKENTWPIVFMGTQMTEISGLYLNGAEGCIRNNQNLKKLTCKFDRSIDSFFSNNTALVYADLTYGGSHWGNMFFDNNTSLVFFRITGNKIKNSFNIKKSTLLLHDCLVNILNQLYDYGTSPTTVYTCTLGDINLAKLTDDEKKIATNKGWTLA